MKKIVNRLIQCILTLFIVSVLCFALTKAAPGDPVLTYVEPNMSEEYIQNLRESLGLTKPVYEQYLCIRDSSVAGKDLSREFRKFPDE